MDAGIGLARERDGRRVQSLTRIAEIELVSLEAVEFHETYSITGLLSASSVLSACTSCGFPSIISLVDLRLSFFSAKNEHSVIYVLLWLLKLDFFFVEHNKSYLQQDVKLLFKFFCE